MPRFLDASRPCACSSGLTFGACCRPALRGEREAANAVALMRSRFTAFALEDAKYLWRTLAATHSDRARPEAEMLRILRRAGRSFRYEGLTILDSTAAESGVPDSTGLESAAADSTGPESAAAESGVANARAQVLFLARLTEHGQDRSFVERSDFVHDGTGWRYVGGAVRPLAQCPDPGALTLGTFEPARVETAEPTP